MSNVSDLLTLERILDDSESVRSQGYPNKIENRMEEMLAPEYENEMYYKLKRQIEAHGRKTKEYLAAVKIQSTWKMYKSKMYFIRFYKQFKRTKCMIERRFFNVLLLNSNVHTVDRIKYYRVLYEQRDPFLLMTMKTKIAAPLTFRIADQISIPYHINEERLIKYTKKMCASMLRRILLLWQIEIHKMKRERKEVDFKLDLKSRRMFGNYYVTFVLWRRWTARKHHSKISETANVQEWNHTELMIKQEETKKERALDVHRNNIKRLGILALTNLYRERKEEAETFENADRFRLIRCMKFALSAWNKTISINRAESTTKRTVLFNWLQYTKVSRNTRHLLNGFQSRHELYVKRRLFSILKKNAKVEQICSVYQHFRIYEHPAHAQWIGWELKGNSDEAALCHTMSLWMSYVRRRRKWHRFVFENIKATEYDITKRKALMGFLHQPRNSIVEVESPSVAFAQESISIHDHVMNSDDSTKNIFLMLNDRDAADVQSRIKSIKNTVDQRRLFFEIWCRTKKSTTLMNRISFINMMYRSAKNRHEEGNLAERVLDTFEQAVEFLQTRALASAGKFKAIQEAIAENGIRMALNTHRRVHRDDLIIKAHIAHDDATALNEAIPEFSVNEKYKLFGSVEEAMKLVTGSYQPIINLYSVAQRIHQANDPDFAIVRGCHTRMISFKKALEKLRSVIQEDMSHISIGGQATKQLERIRNEPHAQMIRAKSNMRTESHQRPTNHAIVSKPIGAMSRLSNQFPQGYRRGRFIHRSTDKFDITIGDEEEESIVTQDSSIQLSQTNIYTSGSISGNMQALMSSFASMLTMSARSVVESSHHDHGHHRMSDDISKSMGEYVIPELSSESDGSGDSSMSGFAEYSSEEETDLSDGNGEEEEENRPAAQIEKNISGNIGSIEESIKYSLMNSVDAADPLAKPEMAQKYAQFMSILFGEGSVDQHSAPLNNLRKRLLFEHSIRNQGGLSGMQLKENAMPIGNLVEMYRSDMQNASQGHSKTRTPVDRSPIKTRAEQEIEMTKFTYGSRRFKKKQVEEMERMKQAENAILNAENEIESDSDGNLFEVMTPKMGNEYYSDALSSSDFEYYYTESEVETEEEKDEKDENGETKKVKVNVKKVVRTKHKRLKSTHTHRSKRPRKAPEEEKDSDAYSYYSEYEYSDDSKSKKSDKREISSKSSHRSHLSHHSDLGSSHSHRSHHSRKSSHSRSSIRSHSSAHSRGSVSTEHTTKSHRSHKVGTHRSMRSGHESRRSKSEILSVGGDSVAESQRTKGTRYTDSGTTPIKENRIKVKKDLDQAEKILWERDHPGEKAPDFEYQYEYEYEYEYSDYYYGYSDVEPLSPIAEDDGGTKLSKGQKMKSTAALEALDKVVFNYVEHSLTSEADPDLLVDIDNLSIESADSLKEVALVGGSNKDGGKKRAKAPRKGAKIIEPKLKSGRSNQAGSAREKGPIVLSQENEMTHQMISILNDVRGVNKLVFTDGKTITDIGRGLKAKKNDNDKDKVKGKEEKIDLGNYQSLLNSQNAKKPLPRLPPPPKVNTRPKAGKVNTKPLSEMAMTMKSYRRKRVVSNLLPRVKKSAPILSAREERPQHPPGKKRYSELKSVVGHLIEMIASAQDDPEEFERLRRRVRMTRRLPTFVGLVEEEKPVTEQKMRQQLESIYMRYISNKDTHAASADIIRLVQAHPSYAPMIIKEIESAADELKEFQSGRRSGRFDAVDPREINPAFAVHLADLSWMKQSGELKGMGATVAFGTGIEFEAAIVPTKKGDKSNRQRRYRHAKFAPRKIGSELQSLDLTDFVMISHYVPESLVDAVIRDYGSNRK